MENPRELLSYALSTYPDRVEIAPIEQLVLETARQNPKRPAYLKVAVPDDLVKQLRGRDQERDLVLLLRVPKEVLERADSPIVLPGEENRPK